MKNILRTALVVLSLAGIYAGMSTPAPAINQPKAIQMSEGTDPTPTTTLGTAWLPDAA